MEFNENYIATVNNNNSLCTIDLNSMEIFKEFKNLSKGYMFDSILFDY
jgi:hypothetical protein